MINGLGVQAEAPKAPELLQIKHHLNRTTDLTGSSPDIWKTIRIWAEGLTSKNSPDGTTFVLVTTAHATVGTAASYLKADDMRDITKAIERLNATALTLTNRDNQSS